MPGITGIIAKEPHRRHRRTLDLMMDGMLHELFYTRGTHVQETARGLRGLDLS